MDRRFAVLVHAKNLLVRDEDGSYLPGGVYTWRCVTAADAESAAKLAIEAVMSSATYADEIDNASKVSFTIDEIVELEADDKRDGSGFVFYLNTESGRQ